MHFPDGGLTLKSQIDSQDLAFPISIGLLDAKTDGAWIRMDAQIEVDITPADAGVAGRLDLGELAAATVKIAPVGWLDAELPFDAQLGDYRQSGVVTISHDDLSDGTPSAVEFSATEDVQRFTEANAFAVTEWLKQLSGWLDNLATSPILQREVPFAKNVKLHEVVDFAAAIRTHLLDPLMAADGTPLFRTAQELVDRLAGQNDVGPDVIGLEYNTTTQELVFSFNLSHLLTRNVPLSLDVDFGQLGNVRLGGSGSADPLLSLSSIIDAGLTFSIDMSRQEVAGTLFDRFSMRDVSFDANVTASIDDLAGKAQFGLFDLNVVDGEGGVNLGVSLDFGSLDGQFSDIDVVPQISGQANVELPLQLAAHVGGLELPVGSKAVVQWNDVNDPSTLSVQLDPAVETQALVDQLESIGMAHIVEGIKQFIDMLREVQAGGVFQQRIPVVNRSLADVLDITEKLDALGKELETNPPTTISEAIDRFNALLESTETAVQFNDGMFEFDLQYSIEERQQIDLGFDFGESVDAGILEEFVNVGATAPIDLQIGGSVAFGLVIDVSDPTSPGFLIKDSSGVTIETLINAADIDLDASVSSLGIFMRDGMVHLDGGTVGQPATWEFGLIPAADGEHRIADILGDVGGSFQTNISGRVASNLPVYFPAADAPQGSIVVTAGSQRHFGDDRTGRIPAA